MSIPGKERGRGRRPGRVLDHRVLHDVVHRKRVDPDLRNDIKELGENSPGEMRLTGEWALKIVASLASSALPPSSMTGNLMNEKAPKNDEHHATQEQRKAG